MIGFLTGEVLFSDGAEVIINTAQGIGYQIHFNHLIAEGTATSLYVSHVVKEDSETLFGFRTLREKKMFEMLLTVKGVGPKSAFGLVSNLPVNQIIDAILLDSKSILTKVPGVGNKGASQIILDLQDKVHKIKGFSNNKIVLKASTSLATSNITFEVEEAYHELPSKMSANHNQILNEALLACKELGFKEDKIIPIAQKILGQNEISRPEQLVHLVLKEI